MRAIYKNNVFYVYFFLIFFITGVSASPVINFYAPDKNGNYYWDNFFLNVSTDINSNCTYQIINLTDSSVAVSYTLMNGTNSTWHNASLDIESLVPGHRYNITVNCTNSTDVSEVNESSIWFYRDYECGDNVYNSWFLGHDLSCNGNGLTVYASNVYFNCNGYTIRGNTTEYGIKIGASYNNITIDNCTISNFTQAILVDQLTYDIHIINNHLLHADGTTTNYALIHVSNSRNNVIDNNVFENSSYAGVYFNGVNNTNITNNVFLRVAYPIWMYTFSYGNLIKSNQINETTNYAAIRIDDGSSNNRIVDNIIFNSTYTGIDLTGIIIRAYNRNAIENLIKENLIEGFSIGIKVVGAPNYFVIGTNITQNYIDVTNQALYLENHTKTIVYNNTFLSQSEQNIYSDSPIELDYNQVGNYWGRNSCPAFVPGVDSNDVNIVDYFPYKSETKQLSEQCLGCGVNLTKSYKLQNNMVCNLTSNSFAAMIFGDNVELSCNGNLIQGNNSGIGVYLFGNSVYFSDFESDDGGWTHGGTNDDWEWGTPTYANGPSSCHSGSKCWGTNMSSTYNNNENAYLEREFYISSGTFLTFWYWHNLETGLDYAYVKVSDNGGVSWTTLKEYTGSSNEWKNESIDLSAYEGKTVIIRFEISTDSSITYAGFYIDDVSINSTTNQNQSLINCNIQNFSIGVKADNVLANITNNIIANNTIGLGINSPSSQIYKNKIYQNQLNVNSTNALYLDYNNMGNFWGYTGNTCPGFRAGVDSNRLDVIDRYPYNDLSFTDYACDCEDNVVNNATLYRSITCNGNGLNITSNNIILDCNGHSLSDISTNKVYGITISANNTIITNCNITSFGYGIYASDVNRITIINSYIHGNEYSVGSSLPGYGIYLKNVTNVTINASYIYDNGLYGIVLNDTDYVTITYNEIYGQSSVTLAGKQYNIKDEGDNNYVTIVNNYWGHDSCPLFLYWRDTNSQVFYDPAPWNSTHQTLGCAPQFKGVKIYKNIYFNKTIDRNETNNWYYYYNNSPVYLEFEIVPGVFMIYSANLTNNGDIITQLQPANSNRTIWRANFTLNVNLSKFTINPMYYWNVTINDPNYSGIISQFLGVININPVHSQSIAYYSALGGATTNWSTIQDFSNVTNLTFEIPSYGKIVILDNLNLLDLNFIQKLKTFGENLKMSNKSAYINSTALKILNKTAIIYMYNIYSNITTNELGSKILMDNYPCPPTVCSNFYYNNTTYTFSFKVAHWSNYTLDDEPPVILSASPLGSISQTSTTLKVTTNENSACRYDTSDKDYWNMSNIMISDSSGTTHTSYVSGLSRGVQYKYYVRCKDIVNNTNELSSVIQFTVSVLQQEETKDETPPTSKYIGEFEKGDKLSVKLYKSTKLSFKLKDTREYHYLSVEDIYEDYVIFVVKSEPITIALRKGETKSIDVNKDGYYDIKIKLNDIVGNYVYFDLQYIHEQIPQEIEKETQPQPLPSIEEETKKEEKPIQPEEKKIPEKQKVSENVEKPVETYILPFILVIISVILASLFFLKKNNQ